VKALYCGEDGVKLTERPEPEPVVGEALVQVRQAGICNTDLEIARGYMGFTGILGHEVLGTIVRAGPDTEVSDRLNAGRVVSEINCSCLACPTCREGGRHHCPHRTVLGILGKDGALAERVAIPLANLHPIPDSLSDEIAVFVEPLAAAMHTFDDAACRPGDRVLVIGDGKLGLLIGLTLASRRGDLRRAVQLGRHPEKLAIVAAAGLETMMDGELDVGGFDVVVEATGQPSGLERALAAVKPRGKIVLKSTYAGEAGVDLAPIVINEIQVIGSRCGTFERAIDALASGRIDPTPLITERYSLARGEHAFERAAADGVLKVLITND
jgi:threonine dehydrogenase-like Zn-dependent dehydrogenase